jgi:hypothetical protein
MPALLGSAAHNSRLAVSKAHLDRHLQLVWAVAAPTRLVVDSQAASAHLLQAL